MAITKVTFPLDEAAILDYHARIGQLGECERIDLLRKFDELVPRIPPRSQASVDLELSGLRLARRTGGRRSGHALKS